MVFLGLPAPGYSGAKSPPGCAHWPAPSVQNCSRRAPARTAVRGYTFEAALALLGVASGVGGVIGGLLVSIWGGLKRKSGLRGPRPDAGGRHLPGLSPLLLLSAAAASLGAAQFDESPGGVSPPGAPRTVHDPLESHGSRCSAVAMT